MMNGKNSKLYIVFLFIMIMIFSLMLTNLYPDNSDNGKATALLIIDVQNFYFPGGALPLIEPEKAADNIKKLLVNFRDKKRPVIHIRHKVKKGGEIYRILIPIEKEKIIFKDHANSFRDTVLLEYLKEKNIGTLVITGMQTHMCVEAATRAAADLGFKCIVVSDACATRDLKFEEKIIRSEDVHYSTLSSLSRTYAEITDTESYLKKNIQK